MREFFAGLSKRSEVDSKNCPVERDLLVLLLLLHDRLQREGALFLRELIQRAEARGSVSLDEFREAIREAKVQAIDDAVWKPKLSDPACAGQLSTELLLEYFGGGSINRLDKATISESAFLSALTEAVIADYDDRLKHMQGLWERESQQQGTSGTLEFEKFVSVVKSEEPSLAPPMVHSLFLTAVELSRSCTQLNGDLVTTAGTLDPVGEHYGGEVVTFPLFALAALRCGLFIKGTLPSADAAGADAAAAPQGRAAPGQRIPHVSKRAPPKKGSPKF